MADEDSYSGTGEAEEQSQDALLHDMQQDLLILVTEFNVPESKLRNLLEVSIVVCATCWSYAAMHACVPKIVYPP